MKNDLVTLIVEVTTSNERGFPETTETRFENIFARISDVKYTEFYAAAAANIRVQLMATLNTEDISHCYVESGSRKYIPSKLEYDGTVYEIVRRYRVDEVNTDLTLREVE